VTAATKYGVNKLMADSVIYAKRNHRPGSPGLEGHEDFPDFKVGFDNVTGLAENSIRVDEFARQVGTDITGTWGSVNVDYMKYLEIYHGRALAAAARKTYPKLPDLIAEGLKK
jgi:hypothetical protein